MRRRRATIASAVLAVALVAIFGRDRWRDWSPWRPWWNVAGAHAGAAATVSPGHADHCDVVRVVDGDTLHVRIPGWPTPDERVRLLRVNTPEKGQPGFERATTCLNDLVTSGVVDLEWEREEPERDAYGRLLAYVRVGPTLVNLELVRLGFSRFFTKFGEGRLAAGFRAAEDEARVAKRGLWTDDGFNVAARR